VVRGVEVPGGAGQNGQSLTSGAGQMVQVVKRWWEVLVPNAFLVQGHPVHEQRPAERVFIIHNKLVRLRNITGSCLYRMI
jgi:hypothetical protein